MVETACDAPKTNYDHPYFVTVVKDVVKSIGSWVMDYGLNKKISRLEDQLTRIITTNEAKLHQLKNDLESEKQKSNEMLKSLCNLRAMMLNFFQNGTAANHTEIINNLKQLGTCPTTPPPPTTTTKTTTTPTTPTAPSTLIQQSQMLSLTSYSGSFVFYILYSVF